MSSTGVQDPCLDSCHVSYSIDDAVTFTQTIVHKVAFYNLLPLMDNFPDLSDFWHLVVLSWVKKLLMIRCVTIIML